MRATAFSIVALTLISVAVVRSQIPAPFNGPFTAPTYGYEIVGTYPHDTSALTQGLLYLDGVLYESTGERGRSTLRKTDLTTGQVLQRVDVDPMHQAEGLADFNGRLFQLTLRGGFGYVYDRQTFASRGTFMYGGPAAAWAIAFDGPRMLITGPTSTVRVLNPDTMMETATYVVRDGANEVNRLDELEMIKGELWANVYQTDRIVVFDPKTGKVTKWISLAGIAAPDGKGLMPAQPDATPDWVLNGIAYDRDRDRLFVTGKNWPSIFEITLKPHP